MLLNELHQNKTIMLYNLISKPVPMNERINKLNNQNKWQQKQPSDGRFSARKKIHYHDNFSRISFIYFFSNKLINTFN